MVNNLIVWILLAVSLGLDVLVVTLTASFSHARLPYLLNLREGREAAVDTAVGLIEEPQLRTGLRLARIFVQFILVGLLVYGLLVLFPGIRIWLLLIYLLIGMVLLSIIEHGAESWVLREPEEIAIRVRSVGSFVNALFSPLSALMMALLGPNANRVTMASMTEEDLKNWVEVGQPEGSLEKGEREMIYSIFQFGDTLAREIMVPRIDVLALDIQATLGEAREMFVRAGHSRVPVYQDTVDNVVGLLYAKDLLSVKQDEDLIVDHREMLRLAYFVPESKKVDEVLAEMQTRNMHMAIVVDEYGGVAGVVTLEDIVEEIIGEIRDEYDEGEELPYAMVGEDEYIFQGRVDLDIFNDVMDASIATGNADTIGGFIYGEIGDVPTGGEQVHADGITLIVEQVEGRRIAKVRARREISTNNVKGEDHVDR